MNTQVNRVNMPKHFIAIQENEGNQRYAIYIISPSGQVSSWCWTVGMELMVKVDKSKGSSVQWQNFYFARKNDVSAINYLYIRPPY